MVFIPSMGMNGAAPDRIGCIWLYRDDVKPSAAERISRNSVAGRNVQYVARFWPISPNQPQGLGKLGARCEAAAILVQISGQVGIKNKLPMLRIASEDLDRLSPAVGIFLYRISHQLGTFSAEKSRTKAQNTTR